MSRIIFVPQYPSKEFLRYPQWWYKKFPEIFRNAGYEVLIIGESVEKELNDHDFFQENKHRFISFSPFQKSVQFELSQVDEYSKLKIRNDDILFLCDISYPGIFCNILYHKQCPKMFAFCHATSLNKYDLFEKVNFSKFPCETAHSLLFDTIFVGSEYHKNKLKWNNTKVSYLPMSPFSIFNENKKYNIISVARKTIQKIDMEIEDKVEKNICSIIRKDCKTWEDYYKFLSQAKILLITSKEDTFNYTILEALMNNTIVLAPNRLCFPELLPDEFLYNNYDELEQKIKKYQKNYTIVPEIKCKKRIDKFFENIITIMEK